MSDPIQRIKYLEQRNKELDIEIINIIHQQLTDQEEAFLTDHLYVEKFNNEREIKDIRLSFKYFLCEIAEGLRLPQFVNWLANKIDKIAK